MDFCILWHSYITASHTSSIFFYINHQSSVPHNPKMMSDSSLLYHSDLHPVHFVFVSYIFQFLCSFSWFWSHSLNHSSYLYFFCHPHTVSYWCNKRMISVQNSYYCYIFILFSTATSVLQNVMYEHGYSVGESIWFPQLGWIPESLWSYAGRVHKCFFTFYIILISIFIMHCFAIPAYISVLLFTAWFASFSFVVVSRSAIEFVLSSIAHHIWRKLMLTEHDTILGCL